MITKYFGVIFKYIKNSKEFFSLFVLVIPIFFNLFINVLFVWDTYNGIFNKGSPIYIGIFLLIINK
jgi:hypothetical protein